MSRHEMSKKEIWRDTASMFVRMMFGLELFFMYIGWIGFVFSLSGNLKYLKYILEKLSDAKMQHYDSFSSNISLDSLQNFFESYRVFFLFVLILGLFLSLFWILWFQIGKSRCVAALHVLKDVFVCALFVYALCKFPIVHYLEIILFVVLLAFAFADCLIMKSLYLYHKRLKKERMRTLDQIQEYSGNGYHITKPKLDLEFHPIKEVSRKEEKIPVDDYLKNM